MSVTTEEMFTCAPLVHVTVTQDVDVSRRVRSTSGAPQEHLRSTVGILDATNIFPLNGLGGIRQGQDQQSSQPDFYHHQ